jgi:hypothetical protein
MTLILIILVLMAIILIIGAYLGKPKSKPGQRQPVKKKIVSQEISNDKLVIIKNVSYDELQKVVSAFCKMYEEDGQTIVPQIDELSGREFAITFPYDIGFAIFCALVNYLHYPIDVEWNPAVSAWMTAKRSDLKIKNNTEDKKVMVYVPDNDTEYDTVFLTTEDNAGYKLKFSIGKHIQQLAHVDKFYEAPPSIHRKNELH